MQSIEENFAQAMRDCGIEPPTPIVADDVMHRFSTNGKPTDDAGYYRLAYESGEPPFGFGFFGDWRTGEQHNWCSKGVEPERKKAAIHKAEQARKTDLKKLYKEAREKAKATWEKCGPVTDNGYLARKHIDPNTLAAHTVRRAYDKITIAMRNEKGEICNLQYIAEDGTKRFTKNSTTKGLYAGIGGAPKPNSAIWVTEGFATAHSVNLITGETTVAAFSADHLLEIAKIISKKYPDHQVNIAGDSGPVGENKAESAAITTGGQVAIPPAEEQYSDWNDVLVALGESGARELFDSLRRLPEKVKKAVAAPVESPPGAAQENPTESQSWQDGLLYPQPTKANPNPGPKPCDTNAYLYLLNHPEFEGCFGYNVLAQQTQWLKYPAWYHHPKKPLPAQVTDTDYFLTHLHLQSSHIAVAPQHGSATIKCVDGVAQKRQFDPLVDYLNGIEWDGESRIDSWTRDVMGAEQTPINQEFGRRFLISAVARALSPGCKADSSLILEGQQGIGKSRLVAALANGFSMDDHLDMKTKEGAVSIQGSWIVELCELTSLKRSDLENYKAFITRRDDKVRPAYSRTTISWPRRCVFIGTTNANEYLADDSGNRRFWPIRCSKIDIPALEDMRDQLWAEAVELYRAGEPWHLSTEFVDAANEQTELRSVADVWQSEIERYVMDLDTELVTCEEVRLNCIAEFDAHGANQAFANKRIASILRVMGWNHNANRKITFDTTKFGRRPKVWWHPDLSPELTGAELSELRRHADYMGVTKVTGKVTPIR